jgi:hypothetical protein
MPDSPVIDVAIGLALIFGVFAGMNSALTEGLSRILGLRADYLVRGIRSLVMGTATKAKDAPGHDAGAAGSPAPGADDAAKAAAAQQDAADATASQELLSALLNDGVISSQGAAQAGALAKGVDKVGRQDLRRMPAYLSSRAFAQAVVSYLLPDAQGTTSFTTLETSITAMPPPIGPALLTLAKNADGDIAKFRSLVEGWYDDHMQRVSGWYKRHVRWFSLSFGAVLVIAFNVNAIGIAQSLYSDQSLRSAVVSEAFLASPCPTPTATATGTTSPTDANAGPADCLKQAHDEITRISGIGVPLGWAGSQRPTAHFGSWALRLLGWLITALALTLGARFWFDALSRLGTLRSSGDKPSTST